ncbi:MAG: asparagine synthase (glutamine-hydrolyzing) [Steroidobacteraceae bacterium]
MCGIAGLWYPEAAPPEARQWSRLMIEAVQHRGPDGFGFYNDERVALAHARLSIIDLSTGDQPIHNEDRTVWTVFNGEIFNYVELRADLEARGHQFYTRSDTEVIVHLYEEFGERFPEHLNGQFAIALWDLRNRRLVLTRDRTGIRPLFHTRVGSGLAFASEVKSLLTLPGVKRALDIDALAQAFTFWSILPPASAFEGVESMAPGTTLVIDAQGRREQCYWDWKFPRHVCSQTLDADRLADELRELMIDAVRLQLRADVPVGAYLSGGLDSSVIALLIRRYTSTPLRTFSLEFEDAEFDESGYQDRMVRHLGSEHTRVMCRKGDIAREFPRLIRHVETPVVRTAPTPLMILSGHVREQKYKVVLTGEGADEVFGGYDIFKEAKIRRFLARAPGSAWRGSLFSRLYGYLQHSPTMAGQFSQQFFGKGLHDTRDVGFAHQARWTTTQRLWQFLHPDHRARLETSAPRAALERSLPPDFREWIGMGRDQYVEAHTLLSGYLLSSQGDRVAMANSIEGRYPFLDHRVIEFAGKLHPSLKIRGLNEKFLLKRAMRGLLPTEIIDRVKQPYRSPDSQSFLASGVLPRYVDDLLSPETLRDRGYFDPEPVSRLLEKARAGRAIGFADNMAFVAILSTMLLDEQLVRGAQVTG